MYKKCIKRFLDIIIAIISLPFILLLILFIAPIIYFEDHGSIFYNAKRLGKNGKVFKMYKFRTMKENVQDIRNPDGSTYNSNDDNRLTKVGRVLRKTSIDELPQIFNVLMGNMSLIGPRPDLPEHINQYTEAEKKKLEVLPGITGYNQAYYRNSITWKERLKNDIYYVENISFRLDIKIFFRTIQSIIKKDNIYIDDTKKENNNGIK